MSYEKPQSNEVFALVDCNNFYVSCERAFSPCLWHKPVVVLSNNDGIIVARSPEIKALKIPMGAPLFEYESVLKKVGAVILSSNYELYGDMSKRVMCVLETFTPDLEIYSIDESFMRLDDLVTKDYANIGHSIKNKVNQWTGIPVSVGIAPTKTLAKAANELAKKHVEHAGVLSFIGVSQSEIDAHLKLLPVEDIWGVGRAYSKFLKNFGVCTAYDFKYAPESFIKSSMTVCGRRTQLELFGVSCLPLKLMTPPCKGIMSSRSFSSLITDIAPLKEAVSSYVGWACEKLRSQHSKATRLDVFIMTSRFRKQDNQYFGINHLNLQGPSNYTPDFIEAAHRILAKIYRPGFKYKKAGVYLSNIVPDTRVQEPLFSYGVSLNKKTILNNVLDSLNGDFGKSVLFYASNGVEKTWTMKRELRSLRYTTRWDELPTVVLE